jgi:hypothetical protein
VKCALCIRSYDPDKQSVVCPHLELDQPVPRLGGFKLRPDMKNQIDDAFNLRDKVTLGDFAYSLNPAARYYANLLLERLDDLEKNENAEPSLSELQE